jgi:predicted nucleic acid-binding protein
MTVLFDTSALLAHYLGEPGGDEVAGLMESSAFAVSAVTQVELMGRLRALGSSAEDASAVVHAYLGAASEVVAVDRRVAARACEIRVAATARVPLADALIAASASVLGATLVHRDPHFAAIPVELLAQEAVPGAE